MRVLITGAGGEIGQDLTVEFDDARYEVLGTTHQSMDVVDRDAVLATIGAFEPDVVVHAGAWTAVDAHEADPGRAFAVNAFGTRNVAEAARRIGAHVVYLSTAYVFDGAKDGPYREWDPTAPLSVYGASKLAGEQELDPGATIVRVDAVWGLRGDNFVKTMLRLANERDTWGVVDDQLHGPSFGPDLAAGIKKLVVARMPGLFHLTNQGATTKYGFACAVLEAAGHDPARITPITAAEYPTPAARPANSVLDNGAWRLAGYAPLRDWRDPLARMIKEIV